MPAATRRLLPCRSYDECEVTAVDVSGGSESYLRWVLDSTKAG